MSESESITICAVCGGNHPTEVHDSTPSQSYLETHRFSPTEKSREFIHEMRTFLGEVQQKIPEVSGLTFFGSRTTGQERKEEEVELSDLDIVVFYDGSAFYTPPTGLPAGLVLQGGRLVFNHGEADKVNEAKEQHKQLEERITEAFSRKMEQLGIPVVIESRITTARDSSSGKEEVHQINKSILLEDVSPSATREMLREWYLDIDDITNNGKYELIDDTLSLGVPANFFLSVGDAIYERRKFILDDIESQPRGDLYFKTLIQQMQAIERYKKREKNPETPLYTNYPATMEEARRYFLREN